MSVSLVKFGTHESGILDYTGVHNQVIVYHMNMLLAYNMGGPEKTIPFINSILYTWTAIHILSDIVHYCHYKTKLKYFPWTISNFEYVQYITYLHLTSNLRRFQGSDSYVVPRFYIIINVLSQSFQNTSRSNIHMDEVWKMSE